MTMGSGEERTVKGRNARRPAALGCVLALAAASLLTPAMGGELAVHGFGTLGVAYLDKPDDWAFTRSLNQRASDDALRADLDSVVGLQVNYSFAHNLELVGQVAAMRRNPEAKTSDYVQLAFVGWQPDPAWRLRLGRVNLDAYQISEHRDVGFTYPFIRPPVEFYSRMPASLDGGDIEHSWTTPDAHWRARVFGGRTANGSGDGRLQLSPLFGVLLAREANGLALRLSALHARAKNDIARLVPLIEGLQQVQGLPVPEVAAEAAGLVDAIATRGVYTSYVAAAAAYDRNGWLVSVEVNRAWAEDTSAINFNSGYVSIGRRFGPVSVFVMESAAVRDYKAWQTPDWITPLTPVDPVLAQQAQALAAGATMAINKTSGHQFTTSAGLRWDISPRVALKAQLDHVRTRRNGDGLWLAADGRAKASSILAVAADFVF